MLLNPSSLAILQSEWRGVVLMQERMDQLVISTFAFDPVTSPLFANIFYNLPFLLAFDVLRKAVLGLIPEQQSRDCESHLSELLDSGKTSLPWIDWQSLREAAERRNEVAQDGRLLGDKQCLQDIANIEAQLLAWGVITSV